ncbi:hypothetical protein [Paenibacillus sp. 1P07SE]|uniref:hypothetical protein n=1 Tax=Paenibacillus sp. 1P07SE TaxID=3132209 RepID=UPI0039A653D9
MTSHNKDIAVIGGGLAQTVKLNEALFNLGPHAMYEGGAAHRPNRYRIDPGMMPGRVSSLSRDYSPRLRFVWKYVLPALRPFHPGVRSTRQSGAHLAHLLFSPRVASGSYWDGKRQIPSSDESYDRSRAEELWYWSSGRFGLHSEI